MISSFYLGYLLTSFILVLINRNVLIIPHVIVCQSPPDPDPDPDPDLDPDNILSPGQQFSTAKLSSALLSLPESSNSLLEVPQANRKSFLLSGFPPTPGLLQQRLKLQPF